MTIFNKEIKKWYIDILTYLGLLVSGVFFLYYVGNGAVGFLLGKTAQNTGAAASYLLLIAVISIFSYCTCEDKIQSYLFFACAGMAFFVLLLNKNIMSIWMMIGIFLGIPLLFRPTAELIKRDMQLLFLFAFMLCNMSLLTNYTSLLQIEVAYSLEISVYLEMVLAIGGLIFFHYWDRLPKGADLKKISMLKLQRRIKTASMLLLVVFAGFILGGNCWKELPGEGIRFFIKGITIPLLNEIDADSSLFFACINKCGVVVTGIIILGLYKIGKQILKKYHLDKPVTNILIIIAVLFMIEFFVWKLTFGNVLLYVVLLIFAFFMQEDKKEIIIVQGSKDYEKESDEQSSNADVDSSVTVSTDVIDSIC